MRIEAVNENTCIVYFGDEIGDQSAERVKSAFDRISNELADVLIDLVPSYTSILINYDLDRIDRFAIKARIEAALRDMSDEQADQSTATEVLLPVYYGPEVALDLEAICAHAKLDVDEVVSIHSQNLYRVYAIGFSPGFAYLGQVDSRIAMPRKATPRKRVPSGSLGIADTQTAIYPSVSPGGWQIIGRTPCKMIDLTSDSLARVAVGDRVRFQSISRDEYLALGGNFDEF